MDVTLLVKSGLGLVVLLSILIFLLFYSPAKRKKKEKEVIKKKLQQEPKHDLATLVAVIKKKTSTTQQLKEALDLILKHHGTIHPKLGMRPHPDFDIYGEVLLRICRHPNTNKDIILNFDHALEKKNDDYKKEINDFITKGLNSRGA